MNKVIITGNICRDIELKQTPRGNSVVTNAIAVRRDFKEDGEYKSDFVNILAWGKQAEYLANYAKKGDMVEICGRWQTRNFEDKDGNKRRADECVVESIRAYSKAKNDQTADQSNEKQTVVEMSDDELPF